MKEKLINILNGTKNSVHFIRVILGGYVAYNCGKVAVSFFTKDDVTPLLFIGSAIVALLGLAIALIGIWAIVKGYSVEYKGKSPWAVPDDDEEEGEQLPEKSESTSETKE